MFVSFLNGAPPGNCSSRCRTCQRFVPEWDTHDLCNVCRSCSEQARCGICRNWSVEWSWTSSQKSTKQKALSGVMDVALSGSNITAPSGSQIIAFGSESVPAPTAGKRKRGSQSSSKSSKSSKAKSDKPKKSSSDKPKKSNRKATPTTQPKSDQPVSGTVLHTGNPPASSHDTPSSSALSQSSSGGNTVLPSNTVTTLPANPPANNSGNTPTTSRGIHSSVSNVVLSTATNPPANSPGATQFTVADANLSTDNTLTTSLVTLQDGSTAGGLQINPSANALGNSTITSSTMNTGTVFSSSNTANPGVMQSFVLSPDFSSSQVNLPGTSGVFQGLMFNPTGAAVNSPTPSGLVFVQAPNTVASSQFPTEALANLPTVSVSTSDNTSWPSQNPSSAQPSTSQEFDNIPRGRSRSRSSHESRRRRRRHHSSSSSSSRSSHSPHRKRRPSQHPVLLSRPVGNHTGLKGRLSTYPHSSRPPKVSVFPLQTHRFHLPGSSLWPVNSPQSFHESCKSGPGLPSTRRNHDIRIHRRLADPRRVRTRVPRDHVLCNSDSTESGLDNQLRQIEPSTIPNGDLSWGDPRLSSRPGHPYTREDLCHLKSRSEPPQGPPSKPVFGFVFWA
ncbi:hypothetical protein HOLleu_36790 [Holothuria leucospilota]|uniref:Uncharacterized protein n=1 Tax=Holothuria leucospilota TaxID=206669 RepID=A0A9Q0YKJ4_HOLLE|nr:hypothetical protein HOLleu_36790 [Holothuria leucospilota]